MMAGRQQRRFCLCPSDLPPWQLSYLLGIYMDLRSLANCASSGKRYRGGSKGGFDHRNSSTTERWLENLHRAFSCFLWDSHQLSSCVLLIRWAIYLLAQQSRSLTGTLDTTHDHRANPRDAIHSSHPLFSIWSYLCSLIWVSINRSEKRERGNTYFDRPSGCS